MCFSDLTGGVVLPPKPSEILVILDQNTKKEIKKIASEKEKDKKICTN